MRGKAGNVYTANGFTGTLREISDHFGIKVSTLRSRMMRGWSIDMAVTDSVRKKNLALLPTVYSIGNVRGTKSKLEKMFGVCLTSSKIKTEDDVINKIRMYREPKFYWVGKRYKGSLIAISEDFGCPMSELKSGIKEGKTVGDILLKGGYFGEGKKC